MKTGLHNITQQTQQIYQNHFLPFLKAETDKISHFLDSLEKTLKKYERARKKAEKEKDTLKLQQAQKELMLGLYALNESCFSLSEGQDFDIVFASLEEEMEEMLQTITKEKDLQQKGEHFKIQEEDSGKTKLLKKLKSIGISFNRAALKVENFFRKLMKKPEKSFRKWRRVIPLRGYTEQTLKIDALDKLLVLYGEVMKVYARDVNTFNEISESFKNLFESIPEEQTTETNESGASRALKAISGYKKDLELLLVSLGEQLDQILVDSLDQYVKSYDKIGTVELPARHFSPARIEANSKVQQKAFNRLTKGWENTMFALSEDWKMDLEIYILSFTTQISSDHFLQSSGKQFYVHTEKQSKLMVKAVDTLRKSIDKNRGAAEETISFLEGKNKAE